LTRERLKFSGDKVKELFDGIKVFGKKFSFKIFITFLKGGGENGIRKGSKG
jgi:hypothetical protein